MDRAKTIIDMGIRNRCWANGIATDIYFNNHQNYFIDTNYRNDIKVQPILDTSRPSIMQYSIQLDNDACKT